MNKVIKKSLTAALLSVFVFSLVFPSGHIIPSTSAIPVANADTCTVGAIGTAIANQVNDIIPSVGEKITYTLNGTISNISDPTTVTVNDALGAGLTFVSSTASVGTYSSATGVWDLGTVSSSSTSMPVSLQISATVNAGTEGEIIDSEPTINYSESVGTGCAQSAAINAISMTVEGTPVVPSADLAVTKNVDVTTTTPGSTVHYTVVVKDNGPVTSTGAAVHDVLPAGLIFQNATASVGSYAASTGIWTIGDLTPSSTATLVYAAVVDPSIHATTTIVNSVSVSESASTTDPVVGNNTASVGFLVVPNATTTPTSTPCSLSASQFEADVNNGTITIGSVIVNNASDTASFTIVNGTQCTAPIGLASYKMFVAPYGPQWLSTQQLFDSTSTSALPASSTTKFVVNVAPCMTQVDAYYGQVPATLLDSNPYGYPNVPFVLAYAFSGGSLCAVSTSTPSADLRISKTADVTSTTEGGTVNYTVKVTDLGPATSTNVVATDTLPSTLTFVSATTSEGSYASSTGIWTIGNMSASSTATLQIAVKVHTGTAGTTITNTANAGESTSTTDNDLSNNSSSASIFVGCPAGTTNASSSSSNGSSNATSSASATGCCPTANATSSTGIGSASSSASSSSGACSAPFADISINKTVDNANPSVGNTVNYTLTVAALGPATSTGVVASDTLPSGLTFVSATTSEGSYASSTGKWTIGDMSASSSAVLKIAAKVDSGTAGDIITNTATVGESASTTDNDLANNSSSVNVVVQGGGCSGSCGTPNADISISKTADVTSTFVGDPINYTIVVTNLSGTTASTGVVATDTLPSGLTFENATATAGTSYASSTGVWTIGTLAPNATATLQIATLVTGPGVSTGGSTNSTITNAATVGESSTLNDPNMSNNSSSVSVLIGPALPPTDADIAITKTVDNADPAAGATVHFTVTVTDNGPATSTFVDANDQLPAGLLFVSASTSQGSYNMTTGDWNIGTIGPDATATLLMAAEVDPNAAGGTTLTNTATVTSTLASLVDPDVSNNSASVTLTVPSTGCTSNCGGGGGGGGGGGSVYADMSITKTVDNSNPATGATIHYTLTAKDTGQNATFGVVADDVLPAGLTFVSATPSEGSYNSSTGVWTIGALNVGQPATLTITATVTASGGTVITNTASVSETPTIIDAIASDNSSSVTINVAGGGGGGGGGGQVLGASTSTGQILGASCGLYLTSYIHPDRQDLNDPTEVRKLQVFLNQNLGLNLPVTGYYGSATIAAVDQFQVKYHNEVLAPWVPLGLQTQFTPTSYVYQTTQRWINLIMCPALNLPVPQLVVDQGGE